jgi:glycosyltransferase involved in cell wall biosynthesis
MALVSVIIPSYNRGRLIQRAVQSVLAQTYSDLEVVVVDDGSKDDTVRIVQAEARHDSRVKLIQHDRQKGAQAARNTGIRRATGEWIAFLDSDDYWLPDSLEARLSVVGTNRTRVVYSDCYRQKPGNPESNTLNLPHSIPSPRVLASRCVEDLLDPPPAPGAGFHGNIYKQLLRWQGPMFQSLLAAREVFTRIGYLDESIVSYQEWETSIRLGRFFDFVFLAQPTFVYDCQNSDSISVNTLRAAVGYKQVFTKHLHPILRFLGPWGLAAHYHLAGNLYEKAGDLQNSRRCIWAAFCLWPFSKATFAELVGPSAHPTLQKFGELHLGQLVGEGPHRNALRWLKRRLRPALQNHSESNH